MWTCFRYLIRWGRGFPGGTKIKKKKKKKNPPANLGDIRDPWVGKISWRAWQSTPGFLPGETHGQRHLEGYSPQGRTVLAQLKQLSMHACRVRKRGTGKDRVYDDPENMNSVLLRFTYLKDTTSSTRSLYLFRYRVSNYPHNHPCVRVPDCESVNTVCLSGYCFALKN